MTGTRVDLRSVVAVRDACDRRRVPMDTYEARGDGWVLFAGVMIMIAGFLNVIYGIAAIDDSAFFPATPLRDLQRPQHLGLDPPDHRHRCS